MASSAARDIVETDLEGNPPFKFHQLRWLDDLKKPEFAFKIFGSERVGSAHPHR